MAKVLQHNILDHTAFIGVIGIVVQPAAFMPEFRRLNDQVSYGNHVPQLAKLG